MVDWAGAITGSLREYHVHNDYKLFISACNQLQDQTPRQQALLGPPQVVRRTAGVLPCAADWSKQFRQPPLRWSSCPSHAQMPKFPIKARIKVAYKGNYLVYGTI